MKKHNTNSPIFAALVPIGIVLSTWWLGWPGALVYILGFCVGGFGTIANMKRSGRILVKP